MENKTNTDQFLVVEDTQGFVQVMKNLESLGFYYFNFQAWKVMEFKWRSLKFVEMQYALKRQKDKIKKKKKQTCQKQALVSVERDRDTLIFMHLFTLEYTLNKWLFWYYCENNCLTYVMENLEGSWKVMEF